MVEIYPELGQAFDRQLKADLHQIGFTGWIHLQKEKRDGKVRLTWTRPVEGQSEWFLVLLVVEDDQLFIDRLQNPLGKGFEKGNIKGLITYIKAVIKR